MCYALSVNRESEHEIKALAAETRAKVKAGVEELKAKTGVVPGLGVVLVGDDPASRSYVTAKERALEEAGMRSVDVRLPEGTTQDELLAVIARLNADPGHCAGERRGRFHANQCGQDDFGAGMFPAVYAAWRVTTLAKGRRGHARRARRGRGPQRHRGASARQPPFAQGVGR